MHHNKLGSLLNTAGRYNDLIMKEIDYIDVKDEENSNIQDNYGEDDDGYVNNNTGEHHHVINKLVNSSAAA